MNRTDPQFKLRIPPELKEGLEVKAEANMRSLSNEMLKRMEMTLVLDQVLGMNEGFIHAATMLQTLIAENAVLKAEKETFREIVKNEFSLILDQRIEKLEKRLSKP